MGFPDVVNERVACGQERAHVARNGPIQGLAILIAQSLIDEADQSCLVLAVADFRREVDDEIDHIVEERRYHVAD